MTDTAARPFADRLSKGLRWLKNVEDASDFSMDEYLLGRIRALEQAVSTLKVRVDGLSAERRSSPQAEPCATLAPTLLDIH